MTFVDGLAEAGRSLGGHRLRTSLSMLGIVMGIAAVVTACAIGEGARRDALDRIGALGVDNLYVRALAPHDFGPGRRSVPAPVLDRHDLNLVARTVGPGGRAAGVRTVVGDVASGRRTVTARLAGVSGDWPAVAGVEIARGRWPSIAEQASGRRVAVLGGALAARLFGASGPVGRHVEAAGSWFRVIGVLAGGAGRPAPEAVPQAIEPAETLFVPLVAMDVPLGDDDTLERLSAIAIRAPGGRVDEAEGAVRAMLRRAHPDAARWEMVVPRALLRARLDAQRTSTFVLVAIGGLALFISGIGIMNIMLASVAERTAEIGVRRALGARRAEIVRQFTAEAMLLCLAGALGGIPAGAIFSAVVSVAAGWPVATSLGSMALALALAASTGLVFGTYPARLAARLNPAEAIRAEA